MFAMIELTNDSVCMLKSVFEIEKRWGREITPLGQSTKY